MVVWWGLFDQELWVESGEERFGPYQPVGGPILLHRYRKHRKSRQEERADKIALLADKLMLPRAAVTGEEGVIIIRPSTTVPIRPFKGREPFHELNFINALAARRAIASEVRLPLAKVSDDDRAFIDTLLTRTLVRAEILAAIRDRFPPGEEELKTDALRSHAILQPCQAAN